MFSYSWVPPMCQPTLDRSYSFRSRHGRGCDETPNQLNDTALNNRVRVTFDQRSISGDSRGASRNWPFLSAVFLSAGRSYSFRFILDFCLQIWVHSWAKVLISWCQHPWFPRCVEEGQMGTTKFLTDVLIQRLYHFWLEIWEVSI